MLVCSLVQLAQTRPPLLLPPTTYTCPSTALVRWHNLHVPVHRFCSHNLHMSAHRFCSLAQFTRAHPSHLLARTTYTWPSTAFARSHNLHVPVHRFCSLAQLTRVRPLLLLARSPTLTHGKNCIYTSAHTLSTSCAVPCSHLLARSLTHSYQSHGEKLQPKGRFFVFSNDIELLSLYASKKCCFVLPASVFFAMRTTRIHCQ